MPGIVMVPRAQKMPGWFGGYGFSGRSGVCAQAIQTSVRLVSNKKGGLKAALESFRLPARVSGFSAQMEDQRQQGARAAQAQCRRLGNLGD